MILGHSSSIGLPSFPEMIYEAIDELNSEIGCNKTAIADYIRRKYGSVLPPLHRSLLSAHLTRMTTIGELHSTGNIYFRPTRDKEAAPAPIVDVDNEGVPDQVPLEAVPAAAAGVDFLQICPDLPLFACVVPVPADPNSGSTNNGAIEEAAVGPGTALAAWANNRRKQEGYTRLATDAIAVEVPASHPVLDLDDTGFTRPPAPEIAFTSVAGASLLTHTGNNSVTYASSGNTIVDLSVPAPLATLHAFNKLPATDFKECVRGCLTMRPLNVRDESTIDTTVAVLGDLDTDMFTRCSTEFLNRAVDSTTSIGVSALLNNLATGPIVFCATAVTAKHTCSYSSAAGLHKSETEAILDAICSVKRHAHQVFALVCNQVPKVLCRSYMKQFQMGPLPPPSVQRIICVHTTERPLPWPSFCCYKARENQRRAAAIFLPATSFLQQQQAVFLYSQLNAAADGQLMFMQGTEPALSSAIEATSKYSTKCPSLPIISLTSVSILGTALYTFAPDYVLYDVLILWEQPWKCIEWQPQGNLLDYDILNPMPWLYFTLTGICYMSQIVSLLWILSYADGEVCEGKPSFPWGFLAFSDTSVMVKCIDNNLLEQRWSHNLNVFAIDKRVEKLQFYCLHVFIHWDYQPWPPPLVLCTAISCCVKRSIFWFSLDKDSGNLWTTELSWLWKLHWHFLPWQIIICVPAVVLMEFLQGMTVISMNFGWTELLVSAGLISGANRIYIRSSRGMVVLILGLIELLVHEMVLSKELIELAPWLSRSTCLIAVYFLLVGYGFGVSLIALFAQFGAGICTKSDDVGAAIAKKVEQGIQADDPCIIAELIDDHIGNIAARVADILERKAAEIISAVILNRTRAEHSKIEDNPSLTMSSPVVHSFDLVVLSVGLLSIGGTHVSSIAVMQEGYSTTIILAILGLEMSILWLLYTEQGLPAWLSFAAWEICGRTSLKPWDPGKSFCNSCRVVSTTTIASRQYIICMVMMREATIRSMLSTIWESFSE